MDEIDTIVALWYLAGLKVERDAASLELRQMLDAGTDLVLVAERDGADELIFMEKWL